MVTISLIRVVAFHAPKCPAVIWKYLSLRAFRYANLAYYYYYYYLQHNILKRYCSSCKQQAKLTVFDRTAATPGEFNVRYNYTASGSSHMDTGQSRGKSGFDFMATVAKRAEQSPKGMRVDEATPLSSPPDSVIIEDAQSDPLH